MNSKEKKEEEEEFERKMKSRKSLGDLKSFSRQEPRKLAYGAIVTSLFLFVCLLSYLKPHFCPNLNLNSQAPIAAGLTQKSETGIEEAYKPICDVSGKRSDFCDFEGDIRVHGNSSTIFFAHSSPTISMEQEQWKIQPYARKGDPVALSHVKEWYLKPLMGPKKAPDCTINHTVPAIIFSIGGFTGNLFHDFTDVIIPLFITSHHFHGEVQFVIADHKSWWVNKFDMILKQLSRYEIIDIDHNQELHCFPRALMGLKFQKELGTNPSNHPYGYSIIDFKEFLRSSFSLEKETAIQMSDAQMDKKPRLLIISRKRARAFTNINEIVEMSKSLDYEVIVAEAETGTDLSKFARLVNSCDVMMGVHGAGLTNMVFLPHGAVVIQIIPFGALEWLARSSFKDPALDMKLKYLEYSIQANESSLIDQYPHDHPVFKDPFSIHKQGWMALRSVYLDKQDIRLHLGRFRNTLLEALKVLHQKN